MAVNHLSEEQIVQHHYGDGDGPAGAAEIEEHLHACAACRADLDAVRMTLEAVDRMPVPERGPGYGAEVWARLQPALAHQSRPWWQEVRGLFASRRLALAGGVAVLLVAAFVAGRFVPAPRPQAPAGGETAAAAQAQAAADQQQTRERILLVAVDDHLERSQVALVELLHATDGPNVDISDERTRARDLVSANRLYRQTALTTGDQATVQMLDDLERVLVEVANCPSTLTGSEFREVRDRIEKQGIIFKVRVFGDRVRQREVVSFADASLGG
jgi:anti-sigma factor RsiW